MSAVSSTTDTQKWFDLSTLNDDSGSAAKNVSSQDQLANKEVFMQLLVAQLKNQNPLNPADGTQFVTQLAQFTQLEQTMSTRDDVAAIRATLEAVVNSQTNPTQNP